MAIQPAVLVIVGITGDLAQRKLLPAIEKLASAHVLPEQFRIVGVTRRSVTSSEVLPSGSGDFLKNNLEMFRMDMSALADYEKLTARLDEINERFGQPAQRLFYLSIPPQVTDQVVDRLGQSGLAKLPDTKLLLEKPFGVDLGSASDLVEQIKRHFNEEQIYRIDHYLAKEMAQNFIVFRSDNSLFKRTWNRDFIESIDIIASEKIGIEGRAAFYEQTGALRDLVQSHLLQLAALTLMETPKPNSLADVPSLRLSALRQLRVAEPIRTNVVRGQYETYPQEVKNPGSKVETYARLTLESSDSRWTGVPVRLVTGKALGQKMTEIRITYKKEQAHESNELIIKIQPDEGIVLNVWAKRPGYERSIEKHALKLAFREHYDALPEAYEQVLLDAINSNHTLFTSSDEVLETWRIIDPVQKAWDMSDDDLVKYARGSDEFLAPKS